MLISDVEDLIAERPICLGTQNQYRRSVRCYSSFLEKPAERTDLIEPVVNRWLLSLEGTKEPETIKGRKAGITAIWNWLAKQGEVGHYNPLRLRKIKLPEKVPVAWSVENVRALLGGAGEVSGTLRSGLAASDFLTAWVWLAFESGIRPSDARLLRVDQIGQVVTIIQHKTGKLHSFQLSSHAIAALQRCCLSGHDRLFGLPKSTARRWELLLFKAAEKHGFTRQPGQALGTLRKTHGTEVCRRFGLEAAARSLGHVSGVQVARRSYVDPTAYPAPLEPPSLHDGNEAAGIGRSAGAGA